MKNTTKVLGIIAFVAISGFTALSLTGCDNGNGSTIESGGNESTNVPKAEDFNIGNLIQTVGSVTAVTITPKQGKSNGAITIYYNGSTTLPAAEGSYPVYFSVDAANGWNAATGLSAGTLVIEPIGGYQTPTPTDFNINGTGTFTNDGNPKTVTITPKAGKSDGVITVYYNGSTTPPAAEGSYTITFDVAAANGWNAVAGLSAGTLEIIGYQTFASLSVFRDYLYNTADTYVYAKLTIAQYEMADLKALLVQVDDKYYYLDLSDNYLTSIGNVAFYGCSSLTSVTIPNGVTSIGLSAFRGCTSLASITIPNSVTSIGDVAFNGCTSLTEINVGSYNTAYSSDDGVLYNKNKTTLIRYPEGKTGAFTIPNGVTSIEQYAFNGCTSLVNVTIPNSVTSVGSYAFQYCSILTSVTIPSGVTSIGVSTFSGCTSLASVSIGNSVTNIRDYAFYDCTSLTSVTIPNNVIAIGRGAFSDCDNLTSVTFEGTIPSLDFSSATYDPAFPGDLRDRFYDPPNTTNGAPGTYTRASGGSTWTKE